MKMSPKQAGALYMKKIELENRITELEKENEWLFDFALGYTNVNFLNESLEGLKDEG